MTIHAPRRWMPCLAAALVVALGCGHRPEGAIPEPRPATSDEMATSAKSVEDSLREMQRNGLTTADAPRGRRMPARRPR